MTNKAKKKPVATTRIKSGAPPKSQPKRIGNVSRLSSTDMAYREAGRAVIGWAFDRPVRSILSCEVGSSGKSELPSVDDWCPIFQFRTEKERLHQEASLREECMKIFAAQAAYRAYRKKTTVMNLTPNTEIDCAIELVTRVMGCHRETAETFIIAYYIPAIEQLIRKPKIWKAIEKIAEALINTPLGYMTAEEDSRINRNS